MEPRPLPTSPIPQQPPPLPATPTEARIETALQWLRPLPNFITAAGCLASLIFLLDGISWLDSRWATDWGNSEANHLGWGLIGWSCFSGPLLLGLAGILRRLK
jgi:hypothetical protein